MHRRLHKLLLFCLLLFPLAGVSAQGAPESINDALADLSQRVGRTVTMGDLENWLWSQAGYTAPCAEPLPIAGVGYQFLLTIDANVYDYRVAADRSGLTLCSVNPVDQEEDVTTPTPPASDEPPYSNPLCPTPPEDITYMQTRLAPDIQARVGPGLPNNIRDFPSTDGAIIGQIPGSGIFLVVNGPECDPEGRLWWGIDYDGLTGWTAEGRDGEYLVEPLLGAALPDERGLITAENMGFVREISRLQGNVGTQLAFTPLVEDSLRQWLVVLGDNGSEGVWIYDLAALDTPPRILSGETRLSALDFGVNPDLALFGSSGGGVRLWDISRGARLVERAFLEGHDINVSAVAFSPDGETIASSGGTAFLREQDEGNRFAITLWDVSTVSQQMGLRGHTGSVTAMEFSDDGVLASGSADGTLRLWNLATGEAETVIEAPAAINDITYLPGQDMIALALANGDILLVDVALGEVETTLSAHSAGVNSVHAAGDLLVSGGEDSAVYIWNLSDTTAPPELLTGHRDSVTSVAFSPDGTLIASISADNTVRIWAAVRNVG